MDDQFVPAIVLIWQTPGSLQGEDLLEPTVEASALSERSSWEQQTPPPPL